MMMMSLATKKVREKLIIVTFVFSILIGSCAADCSLTDIAKCAGTFADLQSKLSESPFSIVSDLIQSGPFNSPFETVSDLFKECQVQTNTISCIKRLVSTCLSEGNRQMFQVTTDGAQNFATELCNNASETHKKYMASFECIQDVAREASQCKEKFALSLNRIREDLEDERSKSFYSCCAFEWMKNCKVKIAHDLCGSDTGTLMDHMASMEVGGMLNRMCSSSMGSCYDRLYGVSDGGRVKSSLTTCILLVALLWVNNMHKN